MTDDGCRGRGRRGGTVSHRRNQSHRSFRAAAQRSRPHLPRLAGALAALLLLGWGLSFLAPLDVATRLGATVTSWGSSVPTGVARWLTRLGDLWVVALLAVLVSLAVRRSAAAGRIWMLLLATGVGVTLLTAALKLLTARPRPVDGLVETFSSSYPSGHATRAAAMYGLAAWASHRWGRPGLPRWLGVLAASTLVAGVALSRLWLGVHRPGEVVLGVALGLAWLAVVVGTLGPQDDAGHEEEAGWESATRFP